MKTVWTGPWGPGLLFFLCLSAGALSFGPLGRDADSDLPPRAADLVLPHGQASYDQPARERALAAYADERTLPDTWGENTAYASVRRAYTALREFSASSREPAAEAKAAAGFDGSQAKPETPAPVPAPSG